jgi:hypothetical protein
VYLALVCLTFVEYVTQSIFDAILLHLVLFNLEIIRTIEMEGHVTESPIPFNAKRRKKIN